jgi:hypothetical protein
MGCGADFQAVRMDVPQGAKVQIPAGVGTPAVAFETPFQGRFDIGSLKVAGGIPMVFSLDAPAASRYGSDHPIEIYARLSVGAPTDFARTQTLRLAPSESRLRALVRGEVSEIEAFVSDPNAGNRKLCVVTMRMTRF